jgi:hypothetical protein
LTVPQDSQADAETQQETLGTYASWNLRAALGLKSYGGIPATLGAGGGQAKYVGQVVKKATFGDVLFRDANTVGEIFWAEGQ